MNWVRLKREHRKPRRQTTNRLPDRESQAVSSRHPEYSEGFAESGGHAPSLATEVKALCHALLSRLHVIAIVTLLTVVGVLAYIWITTPLFSATVEILIVTVFLMNQLIRIVLLEQMSLDLPAFVSR